QRSKAASSRIDRAFAVLESRARLAAVDSELLAKLFRLVRMGRTLITNPRRSAARLRAAAAREVTRPSLDAPRKLMERTSVPGTPASRPDTSRAAGRALPIVFVHRSDSEHLRYALAQAKTSNPNSAIYLLGDASNNRYDFAEHRDLRDYFAGADEFAKIYRH